MRSFVTVGGIQDQRDRFAAELREHLTPATRKALALTLEVDDAMVSNWSLGKHTPSPRQLFAMESTLALAPGTLSRHFGYVPLDSPPSVAHALAADPDLTDEGRSILLAAYGAARTASPVRLRPAAGAARAERELDE